MSPKHDIITLDQIIERFQQRRFADYSDAQSFEIFVAEQILKERDLSDEELVAGNLGGAFDGGIDSIHLFINGVHVDETNYKDFLDLRENIKIDFHIIQAKKKNKMEQAVIDKFSAMADDLFELGNNLDSLVNSYNSGVLQAFEWFRGLHAELGFTGPEINIYFEYATRGGVPTKNMTRKARLLEEKIETHIRNCNCTFRFYGATELLDLSRKSPTQYFKLRIDQGPLSSDELGNSYVALVRLDAYFEFITNNSDSLQLRLFDGNVRDWQGDNKVNVQIANSLKTRDKNDFWWLNNGVTILSKSVNQTGRILHLQNPEIVNGLQTSRAIYSHFLSLNSNTEDDRKLLARVIVVGDETENREQIIRATNSQTSVPIYALRSLDRIHRNIETYFESQPHPLYYDRRKNFYKNHGRPAKSIIDIRTLAQSVLAAAFFKPDDAKGRPSDYLQASDDAQYLLLFNDNYHPELYYFCARFYKRVMEILRHDGIDKQFDTSTRRSVRFHVMTHIVLRHLNIARDKISSSADLASKLSVDAFDEETMVAGASRVLRLLQLHKQQSETRRTRWRQFETELFKDIDSLLPGGDKAQTDQPQ